MTVNAIISLLRPAQRAVEFSVERYNPDRKTQWNAFVRTAKNATFLFERDYMDYHSDRFVDYSLMVFRDKMLMALLPCNLNTDGDVVSHEGLTYGGLVVSRPANLLKVKACFRASLRYLREQGIAKLFYKQIPSFYCSLSNEDLAFVLFLLKAKLRQRDAVMAINQSDRLTFRKGRKSEINKARRFGVRLREESDFKPFWTQVLIPRLASHYGVAPVHRVNEMTYLASQFPENIKQFSAYYKEQIVAGTTIYETPRVAHTQYIGVSSMGQKTGALDYLFGWLIEEHYKHKQYIDFGSCKKSDRRTLNYGILNWKEGFGGRCYLNDFYEIATENYLKLEHP